MTTPAGPPQLDATTRDRMDAEAARWAYAMLFTEPAKFIALGHTSPGPYVSLAVLLTSFAQVFGYLYLAWRVGVAGGFPGLKRRHEALRLAALTAYVMAILVMFWQFVLRPLGWL